MTIPVIANCPDDIAQFLPDDNSVVQVQWTVPTATDNSGLVPSVVATSTSGELFTVGTTQVTYTFTDNTGNEAECSFTVSVFGMSELFVLIKSIYFCLFLYECNIVI